MYYAKYNGEKRQGKKEKIASKTGYNAIKYRIFLCYKCKTILVSWRSWGSRATMWTTTRPPLKPRIFSSPNLDQTSSQCQANLDTLPGNFFPVL